MKTNTYAQFKNFVKKYVLNKDTKFNYYGTSAHVIHSAWYIFKHNLNNEQALEFLKKDFDAMYKTMYNNGISAHINIEDKEFDIKYAASMYTSGGCEYDYRKSEYFTKWSTIVLGLYNIWNNRREEEIHGKE
jgi:hypothetical protein